MEKVFAKKPGVLPDKETELLILDKVEVSWSLESRKYVSMVKHLG